MPVNLKYSDNWFRDVDRRMREQDAEIKALKAKFLTFAADFQVSAVQPTQGQTAVDIASNEFKFYSSGAWRTAGGGVFGDWVDMGGSLTISNGTINYGGTYFFINNVDTPTR